MYGVGSGILVGSCIYLRMGWVKVELSSREGQGKINYRSRWYRVVWGEVRLGGCGCEMGRGKAGFSCRSCTGRIRVRYTQPARAHILLPHRVHEWYLDVLYF